MIALFAATALSFAQADPEIQAQMTPVYLQCMAAAGRVPERRLACMTAETERQDHRLNVVYRRMRTAASPEDRIELRDMERAWIQMRDSYCAADRARAGTGSRAAVAFADCYLAETIERRVWLEHRGN